MSFWRDRTVRWLPSADARKMRCLRLRTDFMACRHSTAFQSVCPLAPFAMAGIQLVPRFGLGTTHFGRFTRSTSPAFRRGDPHEHGPLRQVIGDVWTAPFPCALDDPPTVGSFVR